MNAIINIYGEINENNGFSIREQLFDAIRDENIEKIVFLITSTGGKIKTMSLIGEILKMTDKDIVTIGMEYVWSSASSIFMMGSRRILFPNTEFGLHKCNNTFNGVYTHDQIVRKAKEMQESTEILWEPVLKKSNLTHEILSRRCKDAAWCLTKEEIEKYGIITEEYNMEEVKKLLNIHPKSPADKLAKNIKKRFENGEI